MMRILAPLAVGLIAAALGFWLALNAVPGFLMTKAMERIDAAGGEINGVWHGPITDETSRRVVRPSPDILYSVCLFDLSDGPIELTVPWPSDDSYASVSFYDADTNNFAVVNDRDVDGVETSDLTLNWFRDTPAAGVTPEEWLRDPIVSPSFTGIALYRRVVSGGTSLEEADAERRAFDCHAR
jgi:uncharacterized membrane protein